MSLKSYWGQKGRESHRKIWFWTTFEVHNLPGELGFWNPCPSKSQKIYNISRRLVVERFRRGWPCKFLRGLILGGRHFWKYTKCEGGENIKTQDWPSIKKVAKRYYDWSKCTFPSKADKNNSLQRFLVSIKMWCYPFKAWPRRNLSAISTTRNVACMYTHISLCIELKSGKNI